MRVLCLPYTHTLSHISRPLAIAIELRNRGHEVVFAGDSPRDNFIKSEGFQVLPTYQLAPDVLFGRIRDGKLCFVKAAELCDMVAADRDLFRQVKPDLVLSDGRFSAPISTALDGLKHAAIVNVSSTEFRALPYIPFFGWLPDGLVRPSGELKKIFDRFNLAVEMLVFDNAAAIFKKLSRQLELKHKITATNCLAGNDLTLLADIETYFPSRNLPASYQYIGPLTWQSRLGAPDWWPPKTSGRVLIYFTMGTTWMGGGLNDLFALLKKHGISAIISTGGQGNYSGGNNAQLIEDGVYIEDFVNGDLMLQEVDVVVCHGGNGTIYQALQHGRPIVGIPTIPDQEFNMRRVVELGVGKSLPLQAFNRSPEALFDLVKEVAVDPAFRANAKILQQELNQLQPAQKAADLIEKLHKSG